MALNLAAGLKPVAGYTLVRMLGRGGFGEVWEALAPGDVRVALKFVRLDGAEAGPEQRALEVIRDIRHPHLLDVQFAAQVDDCLVLAMPLCERTLADRLRQCREQGLPGIPRDELLEYMTDLARAVDFLNEPRQDAEGGVRPGVQHRDIKPNNVFLVGGSVRLADFGLAKVLAASSASHTGAMSPNYVAPEVIEGRVSAQSDQYSLAVTYVQLRAGRLPFSGDAIPHLLFAHLKEAPDLSGLPEEERTTLARALAKRPEDRWPSCRALVHDLRAAAATAAADRVPAGPEEREVTATLTGYGYMGMGAASAQPAARTTENWPPSRLPETEVSPEDTTPPGPAPGGRRRVLGGIALAGLVVACAGTAALVLLPRPAATEPPPRPAPPPVAVALVPPTTPGVPTSEPETKTKTEPEPEPKTNTKTEPETKPEPETKTKPEPKPKTPVAAPPRPAAGERVTNSIGMALVPLPPGEFLADSPEPTGGGQAPRLRVRVARPFFLGAREVTQAEYEQVMNDNPSKFSPRGERREAVAGQDTRGHPVENVSWNEAVAFCNRLSEREGLVPYYEPGRGTRPDAQGYRLPTEAEWEYACRAGSEGRYAFGDDEADLGEHAWFAGNSGGQTHPGGEKRPNGFGLYDMHGNVWEWCRDDFRPGGHAESRGGASSPSHADRVYRGGGYDDGPRGLLAAGRARGSRELRDGSLGFRVARDAGPAGR